MAGSVSLACGAFGTFVHHAYTARLRGQLSSNYKDFPIFVKQKSIVVESRSD